MGSHPQFFVGRVKVSQLLLDFLQGYQDDVFLCVLLPLSAKTINPNILPHTLRGLTFLPFFAFSGTTIAGEELAVGTAARSNDAVLGCFALAPVVPRGVKEWEGETLALLLFAELKLCSKSMSSLISVAKATPPTLPLYGTSEDSRNSTSDLVLLTFFSSLPSDRR